MFFFNVLWRIKAIENNLREINLSKGEGKLPGSITRVER